MDIASFFMGTFFPGILDHSGSLAAIIASWVAIKGIKAWKEEHVGKRKIELAEHVYGLFYEATIAIEHIRNIFGYASEGSSRKADESESPEAKKRLNQAHVFTERYNEHISVFGRLQEYRWRFRLYFGNEYDEPFNEIMKILNEIMFAAHYLGTYLWDDNKIAHKSENEILDYYAERAKYEQVVWRMSINDDISNRTHAALKKIELVCKEAVTGKTE